MSGQKSLKKNKKSKISLDIQKPKRDISQKSNLKQSILRRLANCFEAYEYFPFNARYNRFKEKKKYFLEGLDEGQVSEIYHQFVFYHFVQSHKLNFVLRKKDIINYFNGRKKKG
jgi:hypothetical protein